MPRKSRHEQEVERTFGLLFVLVILGVLIYLAIQPYLLLIGVTLLLILMIVGIILTQRYGVAGAIKVATGFIFHQSSTQRLTVPISPTLAEPSDQRLNQIIDTIRAYRIQVRPSYEEQLQRGLFAYLQAAFQEIREEASVGDWNKRIDALIGAIGIEIKLNLDTGEADRLFSQVHYYLQHLRRVIVVLYQPSPQPLAYLQQKFSGERWPGSRVFVVPVGSG